MKLLLVEDDIKLGAVVQQLLELEGHQADWAKDGAEALEYVADSKLNAYDVIVLDWMLPELSGIEVCKILRNNPKYNYQGGVIFVTARDSTEDCIIGLDAGADDYIVKPFQTKELIARLNAICRRKVKPFVDNVYSRHSISIDRNLHQVFCGEKTLKLSAKEFELFSLLFINQNQIIPRATIFDKVWEDNPETTPASLDSYIYLLRKKLKSFNAGIVIWLVKNIGYMMEVSEHD